MPATYADQRTRARPRSVSGPPWWPRSREAPYRRFFAGDSAGFGIAVRAQINHSGVLLETGNQPSARETRALGGEAEAAALRRRRLACAGRHRAGGRALIGC